MPVFLPKRQGVSQSVALAEAYAHAKAAEPELITLALYHPTFADDAGAETAIYIVNDFSPLTATLEADAPLHAGQAVKFEAVPFKFVRPEESDSAAPAEITVEIENASKEIQRHFEHARESDSPVRVMVRTYLPSNTSAPHESPVPTFILKTVEVSMATISAKAGFGNLINERFPKRDYTRDSNPGLVAG